LSRSTKRSMLERRYQRASCDFEAEFGWGTLNYAARIGMVGIGGCFVVSDALVPVDEEVDLALTIDPELAPLQTRAKVVWLSSGRPPFPGKIFGKGFAVEFERIFPEDRARIDEYVRKRIRVYKAIDHEMKKAKPDKELIKELFAGVRPDDSTHLNHIKKVCGNELKLFRLRR